LSIDGEKGIAFILKTAVEEEGSTGATRKLVVADRKF
jgi:hypothetical protein